MYGYDFANILWNYASPFVSKNGLQTSEAVQRLYWFWPSI